MLKRALIVLGILGLVGCGAQTPDEKPAVAASAQSYVATAPGDINFAFSEIPQGPAHAHYPGGESLYWGNTETLYLTGTLPLGPASILVKGVSGSSVITPWCSNNSPLVVTVAPDVSALGANFPDWFGLGPSGLPALRDRVGIGAYVYQISQGGNELIADCTWLPWTPITGQVGQHVAPDEMILLRGMPGDSASYLYIKQHDPSAGNRPIYSYYTFN